MSHLFRYLLDQTAWRLKKSAANLADPAGPFCLVLFCSAWPLFSIRRHIFQEFRTHKGHKSNIWSDSHENNFRLLHSFSFFRYWTKWGEIFSEGAILFSCDFIFTRDFVCNIKVTTNQEIRNSYIIQTQVHKVEIFWEGHKIFKKSSP